MDARLEFEPYLMGNGKSPVDFEIALTFLDLCLGPILREQCLGHPRGIVGLKGSHSEIKRML